MKVSTILIFFVFYDQTLGIQVPFPLVYTSLSMECINVNQRYVEMIKCGVSVVDKGKRRLLNLQAIVKQPLSDFYNHVRVFYKSNNGKFLPHIINLDLDACKASDYFDSKNPIIGRFGAFFERFVPELRDGCPYKGNLNISNFDITKEAPEYLPSSVALGVYKMQHRIHFGKKNATIGEANYIFDVKMARNAGLGAFLGQN